MKTYHENKDSKGQEENGWYNEDGGGSHEEDEDRNIEWGVFTVKRRDARLDDSDDTKQPVDGHVNVGGNFSGDGLCLFSPADNEIKWGTVAALHLGPLDRKVYLTTILGTLGGNWEPWHREIDRENEKKGNSCLFRPHLLITFIINVMMMITIMFSTIVSQLTSDPQLLYFPPPTNLLVATQYQVHPRQNLWRFDCDRRL